MARNINGNETVNLISPFQPERINVASAHVIRKAAAKPFIDNHHY
jgi:hypothetical protein